MSSAASSDSDATASPRLDGATILARAKALAPRIREQGDEIERQRGLPDALYEQLVATGAIRMAMPAAWGGPELSPLEQIEVIEVLSEADASVGWCACILSDCGFYGGYLEDAVGRELFSDLDASCAGMLMPVGRAEIVDGGYRASGHWSFGSGSRHASWITGGCLLMENGEVLLDETGFPRWRILVFPRSEVEILDTWHTTGLAGSGSNDYVVDDVFVPAERSFELSGARSRTEPLYRYHGLFFANVPGIPLGIARHAIDEAIATAREKRVPPLMRPLVDDERVQSAIAEAEAQLGAARSFCFDAMGSLWDTLLAGDDPSLEQRARMALMIAHTGNAAKRCVELACEVAGSSALYERHPLERIRRDMIAVSSHLVHQPKIMAPIGRGLLGIESGPSFF